MKNQDREPETDAEPERAIEQAGHRFFARDGYFIVQNVRLGGTTRLEAESRSDALFEAWHLMR